MDNSVIVYDLKNDQKKIEKVQKASLDKNSDYGLKIEDGLIYGTKDWFDSINKGKQKKIVINGFISKVYMSGHNDFPEFEIRNDNEVSTWERLGNDDFYKIGKKIEITYVEQKFKKPSGILGLYSKCVLEIKIEK
mgnify:CR=1 FL=1